MRAIETHLDVDRPASVVFAYVSDQLNAPRWQRGLTEVRRTTEGPIGVGTEHVFVRRFGGRMVESRNRFVAFEPGTFVEFEIGDGSLRGRASYRVVATGAARSRLTSTLEFERLGWMRPLAPVLVRIVARDTARDEQTLKHLLEDD